MLELKIIENCAPTLAAIKTGSLFSYRFSSLETLNREIENVNEKLNAKGVYVERVKIKKEFCLIYVYRYSKLSRDLTNHRVQKLLKDYGYQDICTEGAIKELKKRLRASLCFPHEIGVFLGYPIEDVIGFIENSGKDCKCCGFWKVYCNEAQAQRTFEKYRKCSRIYNEVFAVKRDIIKITVAA